MDVALLHSLLEANCSLALAEALLWDGWALPLDPEGPYSYCNTTLDQIGTCWPRSAAGALVERPCPEYFNGVKYNTTRNAYRECLDNGTWASRINYSQCVPILDDKQKYDLHYHVALVVNYVGHCVSVAALVVAFLLFLALRSIRCLRNVIHWNLITTFILRNVTWFLLQLIDHKAHENNEVAGPRLGAGPGGLRLGGTTSLAQSSGADPDLSSPPLQLLSLPSCEEEGSTDLTPG